MVRRCCGLLFRTNQINELIIHVLLEVEADDRPKLESHSYIHNTYNRHETDKQTRVRVFRLSL